ncbi:MAG TPA: ATP-binding protein [Gaiellaceae bacterium]|nr:ATP-binding protein [Gaiellaceae bacterium]
MSENPALLLVDDRPQNLLALQAILEPLGHELVTAGSAREALRILLDRDDFAVILLDVQMPDMDGFELAEVIKERDRTRTIPIIFLTALSKEERHVYRGYEVGAVDYVFKPFQPEILRAKVGVFVELWRKNRQIREQAERLAEQELAELRRVSAEQYRQLADAMPQIVWTADRSGAATYFNRRWFEYTGMRDDEVDPHAWTRVTHPDDLPHVVAERQRTLADGTDFEVEYRFRAADGSYRWHLGRAVAIRSDDGEIDFWIGTATDIDDRKRHDDARQFLLDAGAALSVTLDLEAGLQSVARLAVPRIADWCAVDVVDDDGTIRSLAVEHADPQKVLFARELRDRYPPAAGGADGAARAIETGEPQLVSDIPPEAIDAAARDEIHLGLLHELGLRSYICVPIVALGRTLGAITLITAESGRRFDARDLGTAEELALRVAAVAENAQLYEEAERRASAARALETILDGVVMVDEGERVVLWNPAAEAITGIDAADVVGRPAAEALPGYAAVAGSENSGRLLTVPVELEGRELWLSYSRVAFEGGTVYTFRDLTEERALEQMRSDFVATVSHELRTPLAAIYGAAVTLRRADLDLGDDMRGRLLEVVAEESDRLAGIVNDVLLASHLDSGRLKLAIGTVDAAHVTHQVVEAARTHLPDGIELSLDAPDGLPGVAADEEQLRQVLQNLVENAVKYSPDGGPIEVSIERDERVVRWRVRDEGLGVPPAERRRIFEKFYRLDPNMTRGVGGTGLGLYICRELVRRLDGRIWVEPNGPKGSVFVLELPIAGRHAPAEKHEVAA